MAAPRSPHEWQSTRVPKLSYRKPLPPDEIDKISQAQPPRDPVPHPKVAPRIVPVRETIERPVAPSFILAPPKKKGSILSGFFSKEPTISALAQVEADLTAKHGSATPQSVPHVSSRRMPEHVPKVNSRWDGIPETIKLRERDERQRKRLSQQSNFMPTQQYHLRSRSSDDSIHDAAQIPSTQSRRGSDAASHTDSWQSHNDTSTGPQRHDSFSSAASSNASIDVQNRPAGPAKSQSLRSPSGSSLPEITYFFPHHQIPSSTQSPQASHAPQSGRTQPSRTGGPRADAYSTRGNYGPSIEAIPEHSLSPAPTPRELSPATPVYCAERETSARMMTADKGNKRAVGRATHVPIDAFLAGEAKPFELDDERERTERPKPPSRPSKPQQKGWTVPKVSRQI